MKKIVLPFLFLTLAGAAFAQSDNDILLKIGNEATTRGEFVNAYQKNNSLNESTEKDIREYLTLYTHYRMKVQEALALHMDTSKAFQNELASYRNQSAQQYLTDMEVTDQLLEEAFENSKYLLRASHILITCPPNASPKDTLAAYNKIMQIRNKIVAGMDFNEAAYRFSEDPSARDYVNAQSQRKSHANKGELGYFSVLEMIYPFEHAAFNTPVGSISMPIKTQYGYHLIYVQEKTNAISQIYVSQIFFKDTNALKGKPSAEIQAKIDEVQRGIKAGSSFAELARMYSEDLATKDSGGVLMPFSPSRRPANFISSIIHLNKNEISEPVPSSIGWHILKLDSIKYPTITEDYKYVLKNRMQRDPRSNKGKESLIAKLKAEYGFQEKGKEAAMKFFKKNLPPTYFQSTAVNIDSLKGMNKLKPLFTFADKSVSVSEFAKYISRFQGTQVGNDIMHFIESIYPKFVTETMIRYEQNHLEDKYPEHKALLKEFHDGMLLFEINTEKVWNAAIKDSVGLENFYESLKTEYPVDTPNDSIQYKPLKEIRAVIISRYQEFLEQAWLKELQDKYPVSVDEKVLQSIIKK